MRKWRVVGRFYGMKCSWKGHIDRNRHKNGIKRIGQAQLAYVKHINRNISTTWGQARGDLQDGDWFFRTCFTTWRQEVLQHLFYNVTIGGSSALVLQRDVRSNDSEPTVLSLCYRPIKGWVLSFVTDWRHNSRFSAATFCRTYRRISGNICCDKYFQLRKMPTWDC